MRISDATILITGAGRRIGAALAEDLARHGARLILHCHTAQAETRLLAERLPGGLERHRIVRADLTHSPLPEALWEHRADILINNASVYRPARLMDGNAADDGDQLSVNALAPLALMRRFARQPGLERGAVINIADSEIEKPAAAEGIYALSKRLLAEASLAAARELAPAIRVNVLAPGPTLPPEHLKASGMRKTLPQLPLGRAPLLEELASGCRFLIENDAVTGQILYVDCGMHLR